MKVRHFLRGLSGVVWLSAFACAEVASPHSGLLVSIDRASLDSTKTLISTYTVMNLGPDAKQIAACDGDPIPEWQVLENGAWELAAGGLDSCPAPALFSGVLSVGPGARLQDSTGFWEAEPGTYRLVLFSADDGHPRTISEPVTVR